ncbi:hypothetical protein ACFLTX_03555 [Chloroflexota bacterium]
MGTKSLDRYLGAFQDKIQRQKYIKHPNLTQLVGQTSTTLSELLAASAGLSICLNLYLVIFQ